MRATTSILWFLAGVQTPLVAAQVVETITQILTLERVTLWACQEETLFEPVPAPATSALGSVLPSSMSTASSSSAALSSHAASPSQVRLVPDGHGHTYHLLGCFPQAWSATTPTDRPDYNSLTLEKCAVACTGQSYFGVQAGSLCLCSDQGSRLTASNRSSCNDPCTGDANEACGSTSFVQLYKLSNASLSASSSTMAPTATPTPATAFQSTAISGASNRPISLSDQTTSSATFTVLSTAQGTNGSATASAQPAASAQPQCNSIFTDKEGGLSRIYCNADWTGATFQTVRLGDFAACIEACESTRNKCLASVWNNQTQRLSGFGSCDLKEISANTRIKRDGILVHKEGSYVAYMMTNTSSPTPDAPVSSVKASVVTPSSISGSISRTPLSSVPLTASNWSAIATTGEASSKTLISIGTWSALLPSSATTTSSQAYTPHPNLVSSTTAVASRQTSVLHGSVPTTMMSSASSSATISKAGTRTSATTSNATFTVSTMTPINSATSRASSTSLSSSLPPSTTVIPTFLLGNSTVFTLDRTSFSIITTYSPSRAISANVPTSLLVSSAALSPSPKATTSSTTSSVRSSSQCLTCQSGAISSSLLSASSSSAALITFSPSGQNSSLASPTTTWLSIQTGQTSNYVSTPGSFSTTYVIQSSSFMTTAVSSFTTQTAQSSSSPSTASTGTASSQFSSFLFSVNRSATTPSISLQTTAQNSTASTILLLFSTTGSELSPSMSTAIQTWQTTSTVSWATSTVSSTAVILLSSLMPPSTGISNGSAFSTMAFNATMSSTSAAVTSTLLSTMTSSSLSVVSVTSNAVTKSLSNTVSLVNTTTPSLIGATGVSSSTSLAGSGPYFSTTSIYLNMSTVTQNYSTSFMTPSSTSSTTVTTASDSSAPPLFSSILPITTTAEDKSLTTFPASAFVPSSSTSSNTAAVASPTSLATILPRLSNPTLLGTDDDEQEYSFELPFTLSLYTQSDTNMTVTTNGVFSIGDDSNVIEAYSDGGNIPPSLPTYTLVPGTAVVWWHYMWADTTPGLGVYWQLDRGGTFLSVEWMLYDGNNSLTNFIMTYDQAKPGNVTYYYFSSGDTGAVSTVGVQGLDTSNQWQGVTFESGVPNSIQPGMSINFATNPGTTSTGTSRNTTFDVRCFPAGSFPAGVCSKPAT